MRVIALQTHNRPPDLCRERLAVTATRFVKLVLLVVCVGFQLWTLRLRHRSIPCLVFGTPPAMSEQQTPPILRSWGPYRAEESFRVTGEAAVTLGLSLDTQGQLLELQVKRVELGAPDECKDESKRKAEAEHYLRSVLGQSHWTPAEEHGQYVAYKTEHYTVRIQASEATSTKDTSPAPGSQGGDGYATPGAPAPSLEQQGLHPQSGQTAPAEGEQDAPSPSPATPQR